MNYQQIYNSLIERGKNRMLTEYTEKHHIIPRCMGGTDAPANLVELTPEEHYLCHQLLVKMHPDNTKLINAALFMTANGMGRRSNKVYGWLKRRYSEYMKGPNNPQKINPRIGERHHYFGKTRPPSDEWLTQNGRKILSESKKGKNNPNSGIKPWNHPRATEYTKSVWANADHIKIIWEDNNKPSYCKLYSLVNGKSYSRDWEAIGPYMNLVKYFRNGWDPKQDSDWIKL